MKTKTHLITFISTSLIIQSLYFLNPKFQISNHLLWLYDSLIFVGPGWKPQRRFLTTKLICLPNFTRSLSYQHRHPHLQMMRWYCPSEIYIVIYCQCCSLCSTNTFISLHIFSFFVLAMNSNFFKLSKV